MDTYIKDKKTLNEDKQVFKGIVTHIANKQCRIAADGKVMPCHIPGSLISHRNSLAVGDDVEAEHAGRDQYKLAKVLQRKTQVYRGDRRAPSEKILIAANAQTILAVVSADYLINQAGYPEAAIIAAKRAGIGAGLFISKCDLIGERAKAILQDKLALYSGITDVFFGCSFDVSQELIQFVRSKTTVVIGDRACGKTTLINGILSGLSGSVISRENRPSTHANELLLGPEGTMLIDTPGFRSFALQQVTQDERSFVFPEIADIARGCRFRSCTHVYEEGCEVIEALRQNRIKRERYDAFKEMTQAAPESVNPERRHTPSADYRHTACRESFVCKACGELVVPDGAGSQHRNHCPKCLSSVHVDNKPGDRASLCGGIMDPVSVWVRKGGEWAVIHRCRLCGSFSSNRVAADDNPMLLLSIAVKPLSAPPFPLNKLASLEP